MANVQENPELTKIRKRLAVLNHRYDRLLDLNQTHHFTFMVTFEGELVKNPRQDTYLGLLLEIKRQRHQCWMRLRELEPKRMININNGINALATLTRNDLFNLTAPL